MDINVLLDQIPVLHVRGTHRVVGYSIGRQFKGMIDDLLQNWTFLNQEVMRAYEGAEGRKIYDETLVCCQQRYPQYVQELEGMAEGAKVPFHKLFLLHIESVIAPMSSATDSSCRAGSGCTSIMINNKQTLLGHTEDAMVEFANNVYIVAAEIVDEGGTQLEKFTTLTYAGHLPGYTMGFNQHLVYSINTEFPVGIRPGKTPRTFLTRAILGASTLDQVVTVLEDSGAGASDGFSLNIIFGGRGRGEAVTMHNIEVCPSAVPVQSTLCILPIGSNDTYAHCNKYRRLREPEHLACSPYSESRHRVLDRLLKKDTDLPGLKAILSDSSDEGYPIFRSQGSEECPVRTVAVGVFDIGNRTWSIYMGRPTEKEPVAVLSLDL